jgi:hypothetical protein
MSSDNLRPGSGPHRETTLNSDKVRVDPGPYEAIVIRHIKNSRMGELRVYIPDLSGPNGLDYTKPDDYYDKVSYASPFYGQTYGTDDQNLPDTPFTAGQTYGMWMVPPDIGSMVLVTFIAGMRGRGYWFACVYNGPSHHMVPGLSRNIGANTDVPGPELADRVGNDSNLPVTEASSRQPNAYTDLVNVNRQPHEYQTAALMAQGLDRDKIRGAISSSSMREVPSQVYGISTPGRRATSGDQVSGIPEAVISRRGGHSFVMDDGDADGVDQLVRLRTSGGHQILMNDTEDILYIASKTGNQWMEFSADGSINVYGAAGFNLRSEGAINMHSDSVIKMNAKAIQLNGSEAVIATSDGTFSAHAGGSASVSAGGGVSISGATVGVKGQGIVTVGAGGVCMINGSLLMLNCGGAAGIAAGAATSALGGGGGPAKTHSLQDTQNINSLWTPVPGAIESICSVVPGHEPWVQADGKTRPQPVK